MPTVRCTYSATRLARLSPFGCMINACTQRLALNPELHAAEAYMDGTLTLEAESVVYDLLLVFSVNRQHLATISSQRVLRRFWRLMRRRYQANSVSAAATNARQHYDVSVEVYRLFLDKGLNYSCAFSMIPSMTRSMWRNRQSSPVPRPSLVSSLA